MLAKVKQEDFVRRRYFKMWRGSRRVEEMQMDEWYRQVSDMSGAPREDIRILAENGSRIQGPSCEFYCTIEDPNLAA